MRRNADYPGSMSDIDIRLGMPNKQIWIFQVQDVKSWICQFLDLPSTRCQILDLARILNCQVTIVANLTYSNANWSIPGRKTIDSRICQETRPGKPLSRKSATFKCKTVNITRKNNKTVQNLWSRAVMGRECLEMDVCFGWTAATNDREQRRWRLKDAQDASLAIDHTSMPVASSTNHLCCALAALFESHALSLECKDPRRLSSRDNLKFIHLPNGTF
ncbi:hypothetical protein DdX_15768 [Ditylenchus destructor]|uniref:Uncharacterized protein n=1 Tax=Ditylenchus destructor TaxID=166010 RepID=A0AAD4MUD2_9BILA|nr:hypothetical protein DdX_15768 [Ditylenchus destructor]